MARVEVWKVVEINLHSSRIFSPKMISAFDGIDPEWPTTFEV